MAQELKEGQEVTINIPFTYCIGDVGYNTQKELKTVEDCKDEVKAELDNQIITSNNVLLKVEK